MVDKNVGDILNKQINEEIFSSYLYLAFADYFEDRGLKGFANWYMIQVQEELDHMRILRRYLLDNGYVPELEAIAKPDVKLESDLGVLEAGLAHEQHITSCINKCYQAAYELHDFRTMQLLDWFVKEQGEEETNASDLVTDYKLFGNDPKGLYELDREYLTRSYKPQSSQAM